jgi:hypothetical protein
MAALRASFVVLVLAAAHLATLEAAAAPASTSVEKAPAAAGSLLDAAPQGGAKGGDAAATAAPAVDATRERSTAAPAGGSTGADPAPTVSASAQEGEKKEDGAGRAAAAAEDGHAHHGHGHEPHDDADIAHAHAHDHHVPGVDDVHGRPRAEVHARVQPDDHGHGHDDHGHGHDDHGHGHDDHGHGHDDHGHGAPAGNADDEDAKWLKHELDDEALRRNGTRVLHPHPMQRAVPRPGEVPVTHIHKHGDHVHIHTVSAPATGENAMGIDPGLLMLVLLVVSLGCQAGLVHWKKTHYRSYQNTTLVLLWLAPVAMIAWTHMPYYRFLLVWSAFTVFVAYLLFIGSRRPLARDTPRKVYTSFFNIYRVCNTAAIIGYVGLLTFMLGDIHFTLGVLGDVHISASGMLLCFYGMYFGVVTRDCAEMVTGRPAARALAGRGWQCDAGSAPVQIA